MKIAVVGAGIGGLTAAIALKKFGHEVQVFERAPALNEVGAGITLWANALRVLAYLDVDKEIRASGTRATGGVIGLADGQLLVDMTSLPDKIEKPDLIAMHRADLQAALFAPIRKLVTFDHPVDEPDAIDESFDLVVGADGIASKMREYVQGPSPARYSGYTCWRGVCATPSSWKGPVGEYWGLGDRFGVVEIGRGRLYWFAVANAPQGPSTTSKAEIEARFQNYAFDVPAVIAATEPDAILHHDISDRPAARGWFKDRVVLLGDAVHPTTPNLGQGAAMAIESAMILARALDEDGVVWNQLKRYERTRFDRAKSITKTSWTVGKMAQSTSPLTRATRNAIFRYLPMKMRLKQIDRLAGYDATRADLAS